MPMNRLIVAKKARKAYGPSRVRSLPSTAAPTIETGRSFTSLGSELFDGVPWLLLVTVGLPPLATSLAKLDNPDGEKNEPSALSDALTPVPNSVTDRPAAVIGLTRSRGGSPDDTPSRPCPPSLPIVADTSMFWPWRATTIAT